MLDYLNRYTGVSSSFINFFQAGIPLSLSLASALISWLSGSENVAASAKRVAGIQGDIGSREALDYLQGILEIVKAVGYKGLVIVGRTYVISNC